MIWQHFIEWCQKIYIHKYIKLNIKSNAFQTLV